MDHQKPLNQFLSSFIKLMEQFDRYHRRKIDIFAHTVRIGAYEICRMIGDVTDKETKDFKRITGSYNNRERELIKQIIALISTSAIAEPTLDFLGFANDMFILGNFKGDSVTPPDVAELVADLMVAGVDGYHPCSTTASNSVYVTRSITGNIAPELKRKISPVLFHCVDKNPVYVDGCYMQMSYRRQRAHVYHGNTITEEMFRKFTTPAQYAVEQWSLLNQVLSLTEPLDQSID